MITRLALLAAFLVIGSATAAEGVVVQEPWARATVGAARVGAVFAVLRNPGDRPLRIVSGSSPASARVELHTHELLSDGSARMIEVPAIEIPAQGSVTLQPGGMHLMLIELQERLVEGGTVTVTLTTDDGASVPVVAAVRSISAMSACPHCDGR